METLAQVYIVLIINIISLTLIALSINISILDHSRHDNTRQTRPVRRPAAVYDDVITVPTVTSSRCRQSLNFMPLS